MWREGRQAGEAWTWEDGRVMVWGWPLGLACLLAVAAVEWWSGARVRGAGSGQARLYDREAARCLARNHHLHAASSQGPAQQTAAAGREALSGGSPLVGWMMTWCVLTLAVWRCFLWWWRGGWGRAGLRRRQDQPAARARREAAKNKLFHLFLLLVLVVVVVVVFLGMASTVTLPEAGTLARHTLPTTPFTLPTHMAQSPELHPNLMSVICMHMGRTSEPARSISQSAMTDSELATRTAECPPAHLGCDGHLLECLSWLCLHGGLGGQERHRHRLGGGTTGLLLLLLQQHPEEAAAR